METSESEDEPRSYAAVVAQQLQLLHHLLRVDPSLQVLRDRGHNHRWQEGRGYNNN
jgi:hypothetical protein